MRRSGLWLWLKKCLCEISGYRLRLKRKKPERCKITKYPIDISVIICTYNRPNPLLTALGSIAAQSFSGSFEIIIVNNGDPLPAEATARIAEIENARVITESRRGLSYARNAGAKAAAGRILVYLDDDIRADSALLGHIFSAFEAHKRVGIVGGQIILEPPEPRPDIILSGHEALWSEYTVGYRKYREISRQYEFPFGANFSIRHDVLDRAGGFDTRYGRVGNDYAGGEETALCFKTLSMGCKIGIEPRAVVYHLVAADRFTPEHIRRTIRAGILTTYQLCKDGYSPSVWDERYIRERIKIARAELDRLNKTDDTLGIFYKECEINAFEELSENIEAESREAKRLFEVQG